MGTKRPNTSVVLSQESKRSKSDLVAYTNRDKALLESVSVVARRRMSGACMRKLFIYYILLILGREADFKPAGAHNAARGA